MGAGWKRCLCMEPWWSKKAAGLLLLQNRQEQDLIRDSGVMQIFCSMYKLSEHILGLVSDFLYRGVLE